MKFEIKGARLVLIIPFLLLMFSLASGFLVLRLAFIYVPSIISHGAVYISTWALMISAVALGTGIILALAIVRPINRILERAEGAISRYETPLQGIEGRTEIDSLGNMFDRLISSLDSRITSVERPQVELIRDRMNRVEYLATMGAFSLGLAHEIRNPLGYLRGLAELIDEDLSSSKRTEYVDTVIKGIDRLNSLTEELLTLARIAQMEIVPVKVEEVLKEAIAMSADNFLWKKIHVHQNYDSNLQGVYGSHEKLIQVFSNILINAFEATPEGGTITISTESGGASALVHIKNTGSYITPDEREKLFQPFFTKKKDGIGLGLFITKQIVSALSGTIKVESDPQTGTTFSVELRKAA